jgi:signal transduction histidine kinase
MATARGEKFTARIEQYTDEQLLYLKMLPTMRRLSQRRRLYEKLTAKKDSDTDAPAEPNPEIERQIESLSEYVGAFRSRYDNLIDAVTHFADGRRPYYLSAYLRAFYTKRESSVIQPKQSEYVLSALDINEKTYASKTDSPQYVTPKEFNASLLSFAWNGRRIFKNPEMYSHDNNPNHKSWIFSSTNSIASYLQAPMVAYEEVDTDGNEWVCMSFKDEEDNENIRAFGKFLPEFQEAMGGYRDVMQIDTYDYESGDGVEQAPQANRMYTMKFSKPIYDGFNVAYYDKPPRPAFSINMPVYIPNRDSHMLIQAGFHEDFNEVVDDQTRAQFLDRMCYAPEGADPSLAEAFDQIVNQQLETFLLTDELAITPERLKDLDESLTRLEAHRLRTPLTSISGYADLIRIKLLSPSELTTADRAMYAEFADLISKKAREMGDGLSDSLLALRKAQLSTLQIIHPSDYFPQMIEQLITDLNEDSQANSEGDSKAMLIQTVDTQTLRLMLQRFPDIAALPYGFMGMLENILNNARNYNNGDVPITMMATLEEVVNPDTGNTEELVYINIINTGSEIEPRTLMQINDRSRTVEIASENSKGSGRGNVYGRVSMDLSNNSIVDHDAPSIFYQIRSLAEMSEGEQQGVVARLGFRTSRSIKQKVANKVKIYKMVMNGKPSLREQYLQAA